MGDDKKTILRGGNMLTDWLVEGAEARGLKRTDPREADVPPFLRGRGITSEMLRSEEHRGKIRRESAEALGFELTAWETSVGCDQCAGEIVPGALCPWNDHVAEDGHVIVERCDQCQRFDDDEQAAEAVANYLDLGWGVEGRTAFLYADRNEIYVIKHIVQGIRQMIDPEEAIERSLPRARPEYGQLREIEERLVEGLELVRDLMENPR